MSSILLQYLKNSKVGANWRAGGTLSIVAKHHKKLKGPFGETFTMPKNTERGDPLVSAGTVCYAEKQEIPFRFSSLGQMVQFDTIKFCRTM